MSYDLIVYLRNIEMPTPAAWQARVGQASFSFPIELSQDFDPRAMTGFLPVKVDGFTAGFEYYFTPASEEELVEVGENGKADKAVLFCALHNQFRELIAAFAAASMLASLAGGLLVDPQSGEKIHSDNAISWARSGIERLGRANRT
jgi:hypothetical protein